jgi:ribosome-binding ATPase YchF (GTP1/OBG family)
LTAEETKVIANYQFLTAKPQLVVLNLSEEQLPQADSYEAKLHAQYHRPQFAVVALCAKLEMELAQLSDAESEELRSAWGLKEAGLDRIIGLSYQLLGLISFFTTASGEVKAWTIPMGTTALKAAGKIHSDMEKGFIRAEVVAYDDLATCGSLVETRRKGILRLEGKGYTVQDGDVITFLFNV